VREFAAHRIDDTTGANAGLKARARACVCVCVCVWVGGRGGGGGGGGAMTVDHTMGAARKTTQLELGPLVCRIEQGWV
jgi:hypothetical protein